ncbi:MAG: type I-C CRISPR-associated protein Cas8c/Csd1, partial [Planctomycetaceae bacterium]|nr:type I-C CRISPR-associated protein Cas8c/Csd1 [Planctomycetaceae bacterium]
MILQALKEYYDRKAADPDSGIAPLGWEWKEIPYVIVLNADGTPSNIESTIEGSGKSKKTKRFLVPQSVVRSSGISAQLFWDTVEYTAGIVSTGLAEKNNKKASGKKTPEQLAERAAEQHRQFKERIDSFSIADDGFTALKKFLELPNKKELLEQYDTWKELDKDDTFHVFRLKGQTGIITDSETVQSAVNCIASDTATGSGSNVNIRCLITGKQDELELTHAKIKGVWGGQTIGGSIVSVNFPAAESFGKKQGAVSPVGKQAASAFATALNTMLAKGSKNRLQIGDASTVFWASKETLFENEFGMVFADNPDEGVEAVRSLYKSVENGAFAENDEPAKFYVLGLSPNAARISVRFWITATVAEMAVRIKKHFDDLQIVHREYEKDYLSLWRLLVSTAVPGKTDNIPPNLAGETMRAILEGTCYPETLLQAVIRRIRAEHEITYPRAALIKAC